MISKELLSRIFTADLNTPVGYVFNITPNFIEQIVIITGQIVSVGLSVALPIFGVLFITDILLGFTSKMMPQMNIFMVSLPLKIYLGLLLSLMFMRPMAEYMAVIIEQFLTKIAAIF